MTPKLYRKRLIPLETVALTGDEIIAMNDSSIQTKWKPIKPRKDIGGGESWYFLTKGYKISRFFDTDGAFIYWYCDIIDTKYDPADNSYVFTDLLADVVIYPNGLVKVLDVGELADAIEQKLMDISALKQSLRCLSDLLDIVYAGKLEQTIEQLVLTE